jgi:hypothetical protein
MPIALAFLVSAGIHLAVLLNPAWELPELDTTAPATRLDAVLMPPAPHPPVEPIPAPSPKPPPRPPKRHMSKPVAAPASALATAPAAVSPAPTFPPPENTGDAGDTDATATTDQQPASAAPPVPEAPAAPAIPSINLAGLPGEGRLRFLITYGTSDLIVGQNVFTWKHDGHTYTAKSVTQTTGLVALFKPARVVQESHGDITPAGLQPLAFSNEGKRGTDTAHFNWQARTLSYAGHEDMLPAGTQDMLSMYFQLVLLLASANPPDPLELPIATGRKLERYRFELLGEEPLIYQGAPHAALHLKTRNGNDSIEIWIARDVSILPIKIRFTDRKGEVFEQIAEEMALVLNNETR